MTTIRHIAAVFQLSTTFLREEVIIKFEANKPLSTYDDFAANQLHDLVIVTFGLLTFRCFT